MSPSEKKPIWFRYTFSLDSGGRKVFELRLDPETLLIIPQPELKPPPWARLDYMPCSHCPLDRSRTEYCPIAANIAPVVDGFKDIISCQATDVMVEMDERKIFKHCPVQDGLYPLLGIFMSASGCPVMEPLKPLVRHHLPFSSIEETIYRVLTMYVMGQYMRMQEGLEPDWNLAGVTELYERIKMVNISFCERLKKAMETDSVVNSVVILDAFGSMIKTPSRRSVETIRNLFKPYLKEAEAKADEPR
ncbi:MAG: hypothetical protein HY549_03035 [Elusimicrobia bacterium]|nr:hypothetical protein [Elusimicrobiota bacterium]